MTGMSLVAAQAVPVVLGAHWVSAVPLLQWLALAPIFVVWVSPLDPMAMAMDRTSLFFRQRIVEVAIKIPLLLTLISAYGMAGAVIGRLATNLILMVVTMGYVRQLTGLGIVRQLVGPWRVIVATLVMAAVIRSLPDAIRQDLSITAMATTVLCGAFVYVVTLAALWLASGRPDGIEQMVVTRAGGAGGGPPLPPGDYRSRMRSGFSLPVTRSLTAIQLPATRPRRSTQASGRSALAWFEATLRTISASALCTGIVPLPIR